MTEMHLSLLVDGREWDRVRIPRDYTAESGLRQINEWIAKIEREAALNGEKRDFTLKISDGSVDPYRD